MSSSTVWPAVIVGAGAAGMMAAITAARRGVKVLLLETATRPGAKIRVSGGGRCNVLPSNLSVEDFETSGSRNTLRNILFSWPLAETTEFFANDLGIELKTEDTGKVFPRSDKAGDVVAALLSACEHAGVVLRTPCRVTGLTAGDTGEFTLACEDGPDVVARQVVLATGGLSLPKSGSDGGGLQLARELGHTVVPTYPALVALTLLDTTWRELSGLSVPVRLTAQRDGRTLDQRSGNMLFTHRGVSGPVVLDIAHNFTQEDSAGVRLRVHWGQVPSWDEALREEDRTTITARVYREVPHRLADRLIERTGIHPATRLGNLPRKERQRLVSQLEEMELVVTGSEGYAQAEVTGGGVALSEIAPKTLESRRQHGLFLCGEILDVFGRLGGYNFQWAWVTGHKVGMALAR